MLIKLLTTESFIYLYKKLMQLYIRYQSGLRTCSNEAQEQLLLAALPNIT